MKMAVFRVVEPCGPVKVIALTLEAIQTSEISVNLYQFTRHYNSPPENLKS
jgi:hypothetical protein